MAKTKENHERGIHRCNCPICCREPDGSVAREHLAINRLVACSDERSRRLLTGFLAQQHGRGGLTHLAQITGLDRNTIARGLRELYQHEPTQPGRVRRPGAGRKRVEVTHPGVVRALENLLVDTTAGDPASGMKWTHRSLRILRKALQRRGIKVARATVARLLRQLKFSLRTCRKHKAGMHDKNRDRQFRYLTRLRNLYRTLGLPVISVDTKKKELVGEFKNPGRCWRRESRAVLDHDFPSWARGRRSPTGSMTWATTMVWS